jgi:hypothetical protein
MGCGIPCLSLALSSVGGRRWEGRRWSCGVLFKKRLYSTGRYFLDIS